MARPIPAPRYEERPKVWKYISATSNATNDLKMVLDLSAVAIMNVTCDGINIIFKNNPTPIKIELTKEEAFGTLGIFAKFLDSQ